VLPVGALFPGERAAGQGARGGARLT
jgi:hypothetical protein